VAAAKNAGEGEVPPAQAYPTSTPPTHTRTWCGQHRDRALQAEDGTAHLRHDGRVQAPAQNDARPAREVGGRAGSLTFSPLLCPSLPNKPAGTNQQRRRRAQLDDRDSFCNPAFLPLAFAGPSEGRSGCRAAPLAPPSAGPPAFDRGRAQPAAGGPGYTQPVPLQVRRRLLARSPCRPCRRLPCP
jgi:hypothetical protein